MQEPQSTETPVETKARRLGLETIALFEAGKGALVLLAGFGLLAVIHKDLQEVGEHFIRFLHLNPEKKYPQIFLAFLSRLHKGDLWLAALGALAYSTLRFVEAYGLWKCRVWAEWLALLSGGIYLPVELYELSKSVTTFKIAVTGINLLTVLYLAWIRWSAEHTTAPVCAQKDE